MSHFTLELAVASPPTHLLFVLLPSTMRPSQLHALPLVLLLATFKSTLGFEKCTFCFDGSTRPHGRAVVICGRIELWIRTIAETVRYKWEIPNQSWLSPSRIQYSRALEYAPLSCYLAFLPETTCIDSAARNPLPELAVCSVLLWHEAVSGLYLEIA